MLNETSVGKNYAKELMQAGDDLIKSGMIAITKAGAKVTNENICIPLKLKCKLNKITAARRAADKA